MPIDWRDSVEGHRLQLSLFGYALTGTPDSILDWTACLCEGVEALVGRWQDRTASDLARIHLHSADGGDQPVPETWALPAVTELRMRRLAAA